MQIARSRIASVALALSALAFAAPAPAPSPGNILVVDDNGPANFATIQAAVDASIDGNVLLVRPGFYDGFRVTNKSLIVVADSTGAVYVNGTIRVFDLAATRTLILANLLVTGAVSPDGGLGSGLYCANNAGIVRAESCSFTGGVNSSRGALVNTSADVSLTACQLLGGAAATLTPQSAGVDATNGSRVTVYGCGLLGGTGASVGCDSHPPEGRTGGFGGRVRDAFLFGSASTFTGGPGGDAPEGYIVNCTTTGMGGTGLAAENANVQLLNCVSVAGPPGILHPSGCGPCGSTGYAASAQTGSAFTTLPGSARTLHAPTPMHSGTTATIALTGTPGDRVFLFVSETTTPATFIPRWNGMLMVPNPRAGGATHMVDAGTIPASGQLNYPLVLPLVGAISRTLFTQGVFQGAQGVFLSSARSTTVIP